MTNIDNIKVGDRVRLTFHEQGADVEITGPVTEHTRDRVSVGGFYIADYRKVELLAPAWHDCLVIQAGGKIFGLVDPADGTREARWVSLGLIGARISAADRQRHFLAWDWFSDDQIAALGEVRVIVDANGQVVDHG